jgi:hypothetical protein
MKRVVINQANRNLNRHTAASKALPVFLVQEPAIPKELGGTGEPVWYLGSAEMKVDDQIIDGCFIYQPDPRNQLALPNAVGGGSADLWIECTACGLELQPLVPEEVLSPVADAIEKGIKEVGEIASEEDQEQPGYKLEG